MSHQSRGLSGVYNVSPITLADGEGGALALDLQGRVILSAATGSSRGTLTDRSGTITVGGTSQTLAPVNTSRNYLIVINTSTANIAINFTSPASLTAGSIVIVPNGSYDMAASKYITTELVTIIGATTGQTFVAKEG